MKHILFIDSLEKLTIKKDSSLLLALTLKCRQEEVYLLFEDDFYWKNRSSSLDLTVWDFSGTFDENTFKITRFELGQKKSCGILSGDILHMRLDPPFDSRYLRYLWMLKAWKSIGVKILNDPEGILYHNEKLYAYEQKESLPTFIGADVHDCSCFIEEMLTSGYTEFVMKPLDLYQGIGVEKIDIPGAVKLFSEKVKELGGPLIVQPYAKEVEQGEVRSLFFAGKELGSILKKPLKGEFLANIARGSSYSRVELSSSQRTICTEIAHKLLNYGVLWIAFDVLGENVSEVNITCPGLLVEVSHALGKNLANQIADLIF